MMDDHQLPGLSSNLNFSIQKAIWIIRFQKAKIAIVTLHI